MVSRRAIGRSAMCLAGLVGRGLDWFYPRHCYHCGRCLHESRARMLCAACFGHLAALRIRPDACALCGLPLAGLPSPGTLCMTCRIEKRSFDRARAIVSYEGPARSLILAFKFNGEFFLGPRMLKALTDLGWLPADLDRVDLVAPIPLHPRRRRERGYDQALLLARALARRQHARRQHARGRHARLCPRLLLRTRYTRRQSLLPVGRRWDNVRGAFRTRDPAGVEGRSVLLVDDVMTTGVTADECAKALKRAGAASVSVFTLARTAP